MVLTFPAAYHNRNVIFFSLVYTALLWLIIFFLLLSVPAAQTLSRPWTVAAHYAELPEV